MRLTLATLVLVPSLALADCVEDAMLVFDASSSMAANMAEPGRPARITEAREALRLALPDIALYRRLGLVVYGPGERTGCGHVRLHLSPMPDAAEIIMAELDALRPDGNTPLTTAVDAAVDSVAAANGRGQVVLITDGEESCGGQTCSVARDIAMDHPGVTVHVVGFRLRPAAAGQNFDVFDNAPVGGAGAACLADETGGIYTTARTISELVEALRETLGCRLSS